MHGRHNRSKETRVILFSIVTIAFLLRLVHLWTISETAWIDRHLTATNGDDYAFFQWAQTIVAGDWLGRDTYHPYFGWMRDVADLEQWYRWWGGKEIFHQAPLYPYLLAFLLALFKDSVPLVLATQMLIGAFQALIIYGIATKLFDQKVGLVAAAITALYGPFVFYEGTLLRDWLVPVLEPLAVLVLLHANERGGAFRWTLAGAALGLTLLCKATALALILIALAWIVYDRSRTWWETGRVLTLVLAGILVSLAPLLVRNVVVGAPMLALTNRFVEVFVLTNAPSDTDATTNKGVFQRSEGRLVPAFLETLEFHRQRSTSFLSKQLGKLKMFVALHEIPNNTSFYYGLDKSPVLRWTLGYGLLFPAAFTGLLLSLRAWRHHLLLLLYGVATLVGIFATSPISRYRLAAVPVLIVLGATAVVQCVDAVRDRRLAHFFGIAALVMMAVLLQQASTNRGEVPPLLLDYYATAVSHKRRGELEKAVLEIATFNDRVTAYSGASSLTFVLEGHLRVEWAKQHIREGRNGLAREQANLAAAAYAKQPNLPLAALNLGVLYAAVGDNEKARDSLQYFVAIAPEHPSAARARDILSELEELPRSDSNSRNSERTR